MSNEIDLRLTRDEALVFFELLSRFSETDELTVDDPAEQRIFWDLCAQLEKKLPEPFRADYDKLLNRAKKHVLNPEIEKSLKKEAPFKALIGMRLFQVTFVLDYIQFYFDKDNHSGVIINTYTLPEIQRENQIIKSNDAKYRNLLCEQIEKKVVDVNFDEEKGFYFKMDSGYTLSVHFDLQLKVGDEWFGYIDNEIARRYWQPQAGDEAWDSK